MKNMLYSVVLFDADETLFDFRKAEANALRTVFARHGLPTEGTFVESYHRINDGLWNQYNRGKIQKDDITRERFTQLFAKYNVPLDGVEFNSYYLDCLSLYGDLFPGAMEMCAHLHNAGVRLYIITNGIARVQQRRFARSGLANYFGGIFVSEEIGVGKPRKKYFDTVLSRIGVEDKRQVLVVGDSLRADIEGGINAGLDTCWCNFSGRKSKIRTKYRVESFAQLEKLLLGEEES